MKRISARGIVIKGNTVLLLYRERKGETYYSIPGGKVEPGEKLEETAVREILEETSINVTPEKYLGVFVDTDKDKEQHLFICKYINGEPKLGDSEEGVKMAKDPSNFYRPEWIDLHTVSTLKIKPNIVSDFFKGFIAKYLDK